jgi:hypothetical protein
VTKGRKVSQSEHAMRGEVFIGRPMPRAGRRLSGQLGVARRKATEQISDLKRQARRAGR